MKLIESKTLATAAASIQFTSIPQDGTDLVMVLSQRSTFAGFYATTNIYFNNDTSNGNYSSRILEGSGSGVSTYVNVIYLVGEGTGSTSNTFANGAIYVPNYTGSTNKSVSIDNVMESNGTTAYQVIGAAIWNNTNAITSILIQSDSTFVAGTTASLYKITKGSDGIVTTS